MNEERIYSVAEKYAYRYAELASRVREEMGLEKFQGVMLSLKSTLLAR